MAEPTSTPLDAMSPLIAFLDRVAALQRMPREDRIRAGLAELRAIEPLIQVWVAAEVPSP